MRPRGDAGARVNNGICAQAVHGSTRANRPAAVWTRCTAAICSDNRLPLDERRQRGGTPTKEMRNERERGRRTREGAGRDEMMRRLWEGERD